MKTSDEIHRENLALLAIRLGGAAALGVRLGRSTSQVGQWIGGMKNSGTGKPRGIGLASRRRIEEVLGLATGWMDADHSDDNDGILIPATDTPLPSLHDEKVIAITQFHDAGGAMGSGLMLHDQPGEITSWTVTPEWIQKNLKSHSGVGNLCIVTGFGNSMQPLYNPGDPLIVDRGITTVDFDATYFFRVGDSGFVKILQRIPGEGIRVISKNKDFEPWTIRPGMDFQVFGQVLKAWCGTDV